jgi:hypothetical protein
MTLQYWTGTDKIEAWKGRCNITIQFQEVLRHSEGIQNTDPQAHSMTRCLEEGPMRPQKSCPLAAFLQTSVSRPRLRLGRLLDFLLGIWWGFPGDCLLGSRCNWWGGEVVSRGLFSQTRHVTAETGIDWQSLPPAAPAPLTSRRIYCIQGLTMAPWTARNIWTQYQNGLEMRCWKVWTLSYFLHHLHPGTWFSHLLFTSFDWLLLSPGLYGSALSVMYWISFKWVTSNICLCLA